MTIATEKNFIVGETVGHYIGELRTEVEVIAVGGEKVTVIHSNGKEQTFVKRSSDGRYVTPETMNSPVMPEMIFHPTKTEPVKKSFFKRLFG